MPERCSGARVRFAAQNPRALAPSAPFRLGRNRDGRLRREHDEYDQFAGIIYLRKGTSVSPLDKLIMEVPGHDSNFDSRRSKALTRLAPAAQAKEGGFNPASET